MVYVIFVYEYKMFKLMNAPHISFLINNTNFKSLSYLKVWNSKVSHQFNYSQKMPSKGVRGDWSFKFSAEEIANQAHELVIKCRKAYDHIVSIPDEQVNYGNVLKAYADVDNEFTTLRFTLDKLQHISTSQAQRNASTEADKLFKAFEVEISMRQDIFNKLLVLEKEKEQFKPEAKRYLEKLIKLGERNGLHLNEETRDEIKKLKNRINDLCIQFTKNFIEEATTLEFSEKELIGMPEDFIQNLTKKEDTGKCIVTMEYPIYIPMMERCRNPETRRLMSIAFNSRCKNENGPLLDEIVKLRHKLANTLGYPTHAAYVQELLMSKDPETVEKFLKDLWKKLIPLWKDEEKCMLELKEKECKDMNIPFDGKLNSYDLKFYAIKLEELRYAVDQTKLKEYFPLPVVTQGLLNIYQELLGLKFREIKDAEVWHEDVQMFSVEDIHTGNLMGYFFLDMFPRDGKYSHAANMELQFGCTLPDGTYQPGLVALVTNFTKPQKDKPSLLDKDEVITYFHEFGHTMHLICCQTEFTYFNGFNIERDFVEAPSQMLENWCWEKEPLKRMSSHYIDQSEIPDDMMNAVIKSRIACTGQSNLYQIVLSLFDLKIHTAAESDIQTVFHDIYREVLGIEPIKETCMPCSFNHLVDIYDAQYYGYLWSEVYSADMFSARFRHGKILDPEVGMLYRKKILEPGSSKDAMDLLVDFLGREPKQDAFLKVKGLNA